MKQEAVEAVYDKLRAFISDLAGIPLGELQIDTPLFSVGLIDSLMVVEIYFFLEENSGMPVTDLDLKLEDFETIESTVAAIIKY